MEKYLTITVMGNKGDKLHESTFRVTKDNLKSKELAEFIHKYLVGRAINLENKMWIFWELFTFKKVETLSVKKLDKIIREYFK